MSLSSPPATRTSLLERLLGTANYGVVLAVSANIVSWFVATLLPSKLPSLLPFIPEEDKSSERIVADGVTQQRTKCVAIGRPGGMEQLRTIHLKEGYVTCGYNIPGYNSPFVDVSSSDKITLLVDGTTTPTCLVVLRIRAFSINYADCCIRWGLYESANRFVGYPIVPGFDVAGVVEKVIVPSSSSSSPPPFEVGDRVYGATFFGAYSTRCLIPANQLRLIPEGLSFAEAAALPAVSLTALYALHLGGRFPFTDSSEGTEDNNNRSITVIAPSNRSILIHSAAGGVGSMMVQMAKLLGLSPIVGVVGRSAKVKEAKALGCDAVIDKEGYQNYGSIWEAIKSAGPEDGFSIIADPNGVSTLQDSFDHLCPTGRLIVFGFHSNLPMGRDSLNPMEWVRMVCKASKMPAFDPMELVTSNKSVLGFNLSFFVNEINMLTPMYDQIEKWMKCGGDSATRGLRCPCITEMPMESIGEAHQLIQSGKTVGKLVMIAAADRDQ